MKTGLILATCLLLAMLCASSAGANETGRLIQNGSTIFEYEQNLNLTGINDANTPRFLFHYSSSPESPCLIDHVISTFIPESYNADPFYVEGFYGLYGAYSERIRTVREVGYVYIQQAELAADIVLNSSAPDSAANPANFSVNSQNVTRNQTLSVQILNNLAPEHPEDRPWTVLVNITLPDGNYTSNFGGANMTEIPLTSETVYTDTVAGPINLSDAPAGTYSVNVQWPPDSDFYGHGLDSNTVSFTVLDEPAGGESTQ